MIVVAARKVKPGSHLRRGNGEIIKVLVSKPEPLSSASASSSQWLIVGYCEGNPTRTITCHPELEFEVDE